MAQESISDEDGAANHWPPISDPIRRAPHDQEHWRSELIAHSRDLLCTHNLEGRLLTINPAPARILGYSAIELLQIPMREMIAPEFRHEFDSYLQRIASAGEATGLLMVVTKAGERRVWQYHNTLRTRGTDSPVVFGIAHDITDQQQAQQLLCDINQKLCDEAQERERATRELLFFRTLLDHSNDVIELLDGKTLRFLDVNATACSVLGYSREEILRLTVFDIVPTLTSELRSRNEEILLTTGSVTLQAVHRRKDGSTFPVEVTLKSVTLDRNYIVAIARDITDRNRVESELKDRELDFRTLFEQASDGIFVSDSDGRYLDVNSAGARMLGYSREEILQLSIADVVTQEETARIRPETSRLQGDVVIRGEWQFLRKDGSVFPGEVVGRRLPDGRLQGFLRDISERRQAEEALRATMDELRQAKEKLSEEKLYLEEAIDTEMGFGEIVGQSKALKAVLAEVTTVAASNATVLVEGETGTGKELIARALHRTSPRSSNSFIKLNCAAIPSGLLESELFGHEKGAFTGAIERKLGRLELADRGTLFLDEIGEIPLELQPKLLRVLQDHEFERLGSTRTMKVDFRLVVATNRDLSESVKRGEFRRDLYYRLRVFPVRVPPLRERREDIPSLVEHFVHKYAARMKRTITSIPKKTMDVLSRWDWPGNVRELENFVERSVILTEGSVLRAPLGELASSAAVEPDRTLDATQREHILKVLRDSGGRIGGISGAAVRLGLKRTTLQSKLKQLGIEPREWRREA